MTQQYYVPQVQPTYPQVPGYPQAPSYPQAPAAPVAPAATSASAAPAQPVPTGTVDQFFSQPSSGWGPSLKFKDKPNGTTYRGVVARRITNGDIRVQTDTSGRPLTYRDGRPKLVMLVPLIVEPSPEYPEGKATWWVKGQARDELVRAMAEAGAPDGPPEEGAVIEVTKVGERHINGLNPAYQYAVKYTRPQGAESAPAAVATEPVVEAPAAPAAPAASAPETPPGLTPEQAKLLSKLTGQAQA